MNCVIPQGYVPRLNVYETQRAIEFIKTSFQKNLGSALNLKRVSAPLFVEADSGLNDNLSGTERPVGFDVPAAGEGEFQVVQSLAKWKRWALKKYNFYPGKGLYTDMNAIRRDETVLDNLHSVYVDQWDWEKVILEQERTTDYLKDTVRRIVSAICMTADELEWEFPQTRSTLEREVTFITSQELEDLYPDLTPSERENVITREHHTVFLMQIGKTLRSGKKHDGRASMGIRVSPESLGRQLALSGCTQRRSLPYHRSLLAGELPYSIGGGIGQSRLCMLLLGCAHIGEVQCSVWDAETRQLCEAAGINLL